MATREVPADAFAARPAPDERARARRRPDDLAASSDPAPILRSWMRNRSVQQLLSSSGPLDLLDDPRFEAAGVSDPRAGVVAGGEVEGYVSAVDLDAVRRDHFLVEPSAGGRPPNVFVHVCDDEQEGYVPSGPKPLLSVAADLADHDGPRDDARAEAIVRAALGRADRVDR